MENYREREGKMRKIRQKEMGGRDEDERNREVGRKERKENKEGKVIERG